MNFRTLNKWFLTVNQPLLLITASGLFSIKYSRLKHLFIPALKRFFSFAFPTLVNMVYKYAHLRVDCLTSLLFKDQIPFAMRSHVVYKYKCQCCGALYVGQTRRHIHTRISEHMGVSSKTGNKLSVSQMSAVLTHHYLSQRHKRNVIATLSYLIGEVVHGGHHGR